MRPTPYQESQIGWLFLGILLPLMVLMLLAYHFQWGSHPIGTGGLIFVLVLLGALSLMFYRLRTEVTYRKIELRYGIGLISIRPQIDDLMAVNVTRVPWWYGLGIKITPEGWMYTIQGRAAVLLTYRNSSMKAAIFIGTAHPHRLKQSLMENFELSENSQV